jgi:hypothetical protein
MAAAIAVLVTMMPEPALRAQQTYNWGGVVPFTCRVTAVTVATQCQAAAPVGLKAYITDITFSNNTAGAQTIKAVSGTGTNCGTGTADLTAPVAFGAVIANWDHTYETPVQPAAAGLAICVTPSAAISISATLSGFVAP